MRLSSACTPARSVLSRERSVAKRHRRSGGTYTLSRTPLREARTHTHLPQLGPLRRRARVNLRFFGPKIVQGINQSSVSTMVAVHSGEPEPYVGLTPRGGGATHVSVFATAKTREKEGERRRKMHARRNGFDRFRPRCRATNPRKFTETPGRGEARA